jgi:hypothetical protein
LILRRSITQEVCAVTSWEWAKLIALSFLISALLILPVAAIFMMAN